MGQQEQDQTEGQRTATEGDRQPPAPEPTPRERRGYVVLVGDGPLATIAAKHLADYAQLMASGDAGNFPADDVTTVEATAAALSERQCWGQLDVVEAFNRAGGLEEVEKRWPAAVDGDGVRLHLIPERFWQEITPEEQPPPPPRRKWKGV